MVEKMIVVRNTEGLRARTAAAFAQEASKFDSLIIIEKENTKINAKSIMGLLSLGVTEGESIQISADGADAKEAIMALEEIVQA